MDNSAGSRLQTKSNRQQSIRQEVTTAFVEMSASQLPAMLAKDDHDDEAAFRYE
ncbi:hypothetical protein [Thalassoglobus sp.]|uniref:hypothetical protein n=1 Tax=Thalassoglobus sp. TaxID=2795869 RepID=UPI003AA8ACD6